MENNNSLYTQEELDILKLTREKRLTMVNDMTKGGTPGYKEVEVINQMLTSLDKSVHDSVSNRVKLQDTNNKTEILASVAEAIKQLNMQRAKAKQSNEVVDVDLADEYIPIDLVPGEQDMDQKQFSLDELRESVGE